MRWAALLPHKLPDGPKPRTEALDSLTTEYLQFTPRVAVLEALLSCCGVVMEREQSLRIFGGIRRLVKWCAKSAPILACDTSLGCHKLGPLAPRASGPVQRLYEAIGATAGCIAVRDTDAGRRAPSHTGKPGLPDLGAGEGATARGTEPALRRTIAWKPGAGVWLAP